MELALRLNDVADYFWTGPIQFYRTAGERVADVPIR
jgi:hypothetical protein